MHKALPHVWSKAPTAIDGLVARTTCYLYIIISVIKQDHVLGLHLHIKQVPR